MAKKHISKRFEPALVERFDKACEQFATPDACLTAMLKKVEQPQTIATVDDILTLVQCSEDEKTLITQALSQSIVPWKRLLRTAIVAEAKSRTKYAVKIEGLDLSDAKARQHIRGAGFARCRKVLDEVIAANTRATTLSGKRYIAATMLSKLGGVSPAMAIRFCEDLADEIAEHNRAMGFVSPEQGRTHNQWVYRGSIDERRSMDERESYADEK